MIDICQGPPPSATGDLSCYTPFSVVQAQQNQSVAQANLAAVTNGNLDAQVKSAASQVTAATERLKSDQARLDVLNQGPTDTDLQQAQAAVDQAQQQLLLAVTPSTPQDVAGQRAALSQAASQLQKAQSS